MKCIFFLHSTTGNTRLVTRFAADRLKDAGHTCKIQDIARRQDAPPDLHDYELVCFACPTMYWRPTLAMEKFVARLPSAGAEPRPVIQLATAAGDPGAHFALLAEQLEYKGWITLGARFVPMVNNWPPHRALSDKVPLAQSTATSLSNLQSSLRPTMSLLWPDVGEPEPRHRDDVGSWIQRMADRVEAKDLSRAPAPAALWKGNKLFYVIGRLMTAEQMRQGTQIAIDPARCGRCGTCVKLCPVDCLTRAGEDDVPTVGPNCTGCWTCHNQCPDKAISGFGAPHGAGRFEGPTAETRALFR
jgi:NAD-dependent dihydropyrimidine dehydrogenase PreA subunit